MSLIDNEHKRKSLIITVVVHTLILIFLLYAGMTYLDPPLEKGIAINFGTTEVGSGDVQPLEEIATAPKQATSNPISQTTPEVKEEVITQNIEEAPVVKKEETKKIVQIPVKEQPKTEIQKPDPKPSKSTSDALASIIDGPKNNGLAQGGEGNDNKPGDKGDPSGDPNASSYYGTGKGLDGDGNYLLGGRKALNKEKFLQDCNEAGVVVVSIEVDRQGKVIKATPGQQGSTNNATCLWEPAKRAAMATRFNADANAPTKQIGKIIYNFSLSN